MLFRSKEAKLKRQTFLSIDFLYNCTTHSTTIFGIVITLTVSLHYGTTITWAFRCLSLCHKTEIPDLLATLPLYPWNPPRPCSLDKTPTTPLLHLKPPTLVGSRGAVLQIEVRKCMCIGSCIALRCYLLS